MNYAKHIKNIILVILGTFILAFGIYNLNDQHNLAEGGVLGFLLLLKNTFDISLGYTSLIIDVILFALAYKFFGKHFLLHSLLATISFSSFYSLLERYQPILPDLSNYMFFTSLLAGLFVGIGAGLVLLGGGAAGGDDAFALLVAKYTPLKVNHFYLILDGIVLALSLTYLAPLQLIWSFIAVFTSGKVMGMIHHYSLYKQKQRSHSYDLHVPHGMAMKKAI